MFNCVGLFGLSWGWYHFTESAHVVANITMSDNQHRWLVSNIFYFHPYLGKIPILTNIFQRGWNHQPVLVFLVSEFDFKSIKDIHNWRWASWQIWRQEIRTRCWPYCYTFTRMWFHTIHTYYDHVCSACWCVYYTYPLCISSLAETWCIFHNFWSKCHGISKGAPRFHNATFPQPRNESLIKRLYGGFLKCWYPQIIHFNRVFHYFHHPFWGAPIFGNTHILL